MKLYKRQIRPMMYSPGCQGFSDTYIPIKNMDDWYDEEWSNGQCTEDLLTAYYSKKVKEKDPWATIKFDERYVVVSKI